MARVEERIDAGFVASTAPDEAGPRRRGDLARLPWISFVIIAVMGFVAVLAPLIAPHSPTEQSLPDKLRPPAWQEGGSGKHLLGTDVLGRDVLSRLIYGARVSLIVAAVALLAGGGIGLIVGIVSGYLGGRVDSFLMFVPPSSWSHTGGFCDDRRPPSSRVVAISCACAHQVAGARRASSSRRCPIRARRRPSPSRRRPG